MTIARQFEMVQRGILAGVAGGLAEIAWVTFYAAITGGDPAAVARGITTAVGVSALLPSSPAALGIAVHMSLALGLGVTLAFVWQTCRSRWPRMTNPYPLMLAALSGVWALNFLVVLPVVSASFVHMLPYAASLTSKLLFGLAAAETLRRQGRPLAVARYLYR
jgi:hypothetical protein